MNRENHLSTGGLQRIWTLLLALFLGVVCVPQSGATVYVSAGTPADVQRIHDIQAQNGDTITLPFGTFTWASGITITKAITLQGAGVGTTIIKDGVQSGALISYVLVPAQTSRLTGIEFQNGGRPTYYTGVVTFTGSNTNASQMRMDHCKWSQDVNGSPLFNTVIGVIDHNTFVRSGGEDGHCFWVYGSGWNGGAYGDGSWSTPTAFGSSQFLFFEDNTFTSNQPAYQLALCDAYDGARFVMRHNSITGGFFFTNHGTESSARRRGSRANEFYNNTMDGANINQFVGGSRSGAQVVHDNTVSNYPGGGSWSLAAYRAVAPFPVFGGADGTNPWDVNDPTVYFTGTAAANSSGTTVTVSGNPGWIPNQWVGYTVRRTTNLCHSSSNTFGMITSNTSNTLTSYDWPPSITFLYGRYCRDSQGDSSPGSTWQGAWITHQRRQPNPAIRMERSSH